MSHEGAWTDPPASATGSDALKSMAAVAAVDLVRSGMRIGLGSGSTAMLALRHLAERLETGALRDIIGCPTSQTTRAEATRLGVAMMGDDLAEPLDLTIDGADEIDPDLNIIKGGGGALLREKIVAQASHRVVIIADASKLSPRLGTHWPVPVEVLAFGWRSQARFLEALGGAPALRRRPDGEPFTTDSGHYLLDCHFGPVADAMRLAHTLAARAGIVEHGLFIDMAHDVIVASADGIRHRTRNEA
jgi:ribose 5-phosphate isomerase A